MGGQEVPRAIITCQDACDADGVRTRADARDAPPDETIDHERGDAELSETAPPVRLRSEQACGRTMAGTRSSPSGSLKMPKTVAGFPSSGAGMNGGVNKMPGKVRLWK